MKRLNESVIAAHKHMKLCGDVYSDFITVEASEDLCYLTPTALNVYKDWVLSKELFMEAVENVYNDNKDV